MGTKYEKRDLKYYIVDVFGSEKYSGNQLAVFTNPQNITSAEMQLIAHETNFSETTFITGYNLDMNIFDVRIFTPYQEVPFAGHPTLGTAFIANKYFLDDFAKEVHLNLLAGKIPVTRIEGKLWMKQLQPQFGKQFEISTISKVLGLAEDDLLSDFPIETVSTGLPFIIVPVANLSALKKISLDNSIIEKLLQDSKTKEIIVFSMDTYDGSHQVAARVFVPEYGIIEDAATGSANGCLSAYLLKHNVLKAKSIEITVAQGYEINRPSAIYHNSKLTDSGYEINIGGKIIPVAEGIWY
jgi:trans-2,3-dihydro-3-hydroxyanthranilate isomerase